MSVPETGASPITTDHRAKWAYVYVRQSSLSQVARHGESTELQYRLVERAVALGWPRERIHVIDDDLGKSGASAEQRAGFQRLIAEIGLARVGLVVSLDASRLARNNSDWYRLIELCAVFGTLLADGERLYDPRRYHDRLLLGLSGMMSEAELHQLKLRLHAGERQKAERGELHLPLPVGLERQPDGRLGLHPDEEVQARLGLIFAKFDELGSAHAVMRYLRRAGLPVPVRPLRGPAPHPVRWSPATVDQVLAILHNPAYAGAYVYGQSTVDPARRRPDRPTSGRRHRPLAQWPVCRLDHYPAYISWEQYLRNQDRLRANQANYRAESPGVPRRGPALLQGIVRCGRCGARMALRYSGSAGQYPVYTCRIAYQTADRPRCQEVRAPGLDAAIIHHLLAALEPDRLALALAALEHLEQDTATLRRQWQHRLERARYEAERARRQYQAVEPEHRLVARSLERQWEDQLRALETLEHDYQRWTAQQPLTLTAPDRLAILALAQDLPRVWHAATTTDADRKQMLRLVIHSVSVDARREPGRLWYRIGWQTGTTSEHLMERTVHRYAEHSRFEALQQRVRELHAAYCSDEDIAATLDVEGFRTARGRRFNGPLVWQLRQQWHLPTFPHHGSGPMPLQWDDGTYSVAGAAQTVGVTPGTVYGWICNGRLSGQQRAKGLPWQITLADEDIDSLRQYVQRVRRIKRSKMEVA